jgi:hypothetical protein
MEDIQVEGKTGKQKQDRVSLDGDSLERLNKWLAQLQEELQGIKVSRTDLVRWLIHSHAVLLTRNEMDGIREQCFDDVEYASWALRQVKKARAEGQKLSLQDVMKAHSPRVARAKRTHRARQLSEDAHLRSGAIVLAPGGSQANDPKCLK